MLGRKDVDAVTIATPDHWHTTIAVEAMRAGKDLYCEKPLTIDGGKLLERVVKETGRVLQVVTMQRTQSGRWARHTWPTSWRRSGLGSSRSRTSGRTIRMLEICPLWNIAMPLGRESRKGHEIAAA